jgi:hypothetical protein
MKTLTLCLLLAMGCSCFGQDSWEVQKWVPSDAARLRLTETLSL